MNESTPNKPTRERLPWLRRALAVAIAFAFGIGLMSGSGVAEAAPQEEDFEFEPDEMDEVDEDDEDDEDDDGLEFEPDRVRRPGEIPTGATENPDDPNALTVERREEPAPPPAPVVREGYPIEQALRPITLDAGMFELAVAAPMYPSPASFITTLQARYGITDPLEVGVRYAFFAADEGGSTVGKGGSLDFVYTITEWIGVQLSTPILFDPFAMGITLGAPMQFRFGDSFALFFGSDLLSFRVAKFVPTVEDPRIDAARAAALELNTIVSAGSLRFVGGAIYQFAPHVALIADTGVVVEDFGRNGEQPQVPLGATLSYSVVDSLDFSGRLGFDDIGDGGSFRFTGGFALRL
ncbi:hypothetical protein [Haliangium ochraceum]|uniref:Uncharacterized protein n=1 Tax=Haliangium ochraceum (strain DSM 14365 / JCM 11303 / SMP-2) TaxID=502025 RepID=D0LV40_HALO1|nr:hypothetical protein [Haliangium ochraceum]ACY15881.1 hypothetical protein Hoch_3379 [Haliangium ochraceum DSM 14365]